MDAHRVSRRARHFTVIVAILGAGSALGVMVGGAGATTPPFTASWVYGSQSGHVLFTQTNNSGKAVSFFEIMLGSGVTVNSGTVTNVTGISCIPGSMPGTLDCQASGPTEDWADGETLDVDVDETGVSGTPTFDEFVTYADATTGTFQAPYAQPTGSTSSSTSTSTSTSTPGSTPPPSTSSSTSTPPPPCQCYSLGLFPQPIHNFSTADKGSGKHEKVTWRFVLWWTLSCTEGAGGCKGTLTIVPPKKVGGLPTDASVATSSQKAKECKGCFEHFKTPQSGPTIECATNCGHYELGESLVEITGGPAMNAHNREGETVNFEIKAACANEKPKKYKVEIFFGSFGKPAHIKVTP